MKTILDWISKSAASWGVHGLENSGAFKSMRQFEQFAATKVKAGKQSLGEWVTSTKSMHERREAMGKLRQRLRDDPGSIPNKAAYRKEIFDQGLDNAVHTAGYPFRVAGKGALVGGLYGLKGVVTGGLLGVLGVGYVGAKLIGPHVVNGAVRAPGLAVNAAHTVVGAAIKTAVGAEMAARVLLTGGITGVRSNAVDAWLPNFRNMPSSNLAKYAPNANIAPRILAAAAVIGIGSALFDSITPKAAPASAYFDGEHVVPLSGPRASSQAGYGQRVMNSAGSFGNMNYQTVSQSLVHLL